MDNTYSIPQQVVYDLVKFIGVTLEKECLTASAEKCRSDLYHSLQPFIVQECDDIQEDQCENLHPVRVHSHFVDSEETKITYSYHEIRNKTTKCGPLWYKQKGILRDGWRKYFAGLCGHALVLYSSERDLKPNVSLNIQGYVARPAPNSQKDPKKKSITFEVVCPGKRDYQFFARTVKDMEQWIASICQASIQDIDDFSPLSSKQSLRTSKTTDTETENYDACSIMETSVGSTQFEEEFYDDIGDSKITMDSRAERKQILSQSLYQTRTEKNSTSEGEELYNDIDENVNTLDLMNCMSERNTTDVGESFEPSLKNSVKVVERRLLLPPPEDEGFYNYIEEFDKSESNCTTASITKVLPPRAQNFSIKEDEIYHDIEEYTKNLSSSSVQKNVTDRPPPPLPARRPLPSIPKESFEGETYDDVEVTSTNKQSGLIPSFKEDDIEVVNPRQQSGPMITVINTHIEIQDTIYDDVGCQALREYSEYTPSAMDTPTQTEQEEIYDDVDTSPFPTKNILSTNHEKKCINNRHVSDLPKNIHTSIQKNNMHKQSKMESMEISAKVNETKRNTILGNKITEQSLADIAYGNTNEQVSKSPFQKKYIGGNAVNNAKSLNVSENEASHEDMSEQKYRTHEIRDSNDVKHQDASVKRISVKCITDKLSKHKNSTFLYRNTVNDKDELSQCQELNPGKETSFSPKNHGFMRPTNNLFKYIITSENNGENVQRALKNIEISSSVEHKPSNDHPQKLTSTNTSKPNEISTAANKTHSKTKHSMNHLKNESNPLTRPPVQTPLSESPKLASKPNKHTLHNFRPPVAASLSASSSNSCEFSSKNKHFPLSISKFSDELASDPSNFQSNNSNISTGTGQSSNSNGFSIQQIQNDMFTLHDESSKTMTTNMASQCSDLHKNSNKMSTSSSNRLTVSASVLSTSSSQHTVIRSWNKPNNLQQAILGVPLPPELPPRPYIKK